MKKSILGVFCVLLLTVAGCYDPACNTCGPNQNPNQGFCDFSTSFGHCTWEDLASEITCDNYLCDKDVIKEIDAIPGVQVQCNVRAEAYQASHNHYCVVYKDVWGEYEVGCGHCGSRWKITAQ